MVAMIENYEKVLAVGLGDGASAALLTALSKVFGSLPHDSLFPKP